MASNNKPGEDAVSNEAVFTDDGVKAAGVRTREALDNFTANRAPAMSARTAEDIVNDAVKHPSHYQLPNGLECIDVVQHFNFNRGGAIKYIWRAGKKSVSEEIQDLQKAAELLDFEINRLTAEKTF